MGPAFPAGTLSFHIRRRPADHQPRKRKKKAPSGGGTVPPDEGLPMLQEVLPGGGGAPGPCHPIPLHMTEVGSAPSGSQGLQVGVLALPLALLGCARSVVLNRAPPTVVTQWQRCCAAETKDTGLTLTTVAAFLIKGKSKYARVSGFRDPPRGQNSSGGLCLGAPHSPGVALHVKPHTISRVGT